MDVLVVGWGGGVGIGRCKKMGRGGCEVWDLGVDTPRKCHISFNLIFFFCFPFRK